MERVEMGEERTRTTVFTLAEIIHVSLRRRAPRSRLVLSIKRLVGIPGLRIGEVRKDLCLPALELAAEYRVDFIDAHPLHPGVGQDRSDRADRGAPEGSQPRVPFTLLAFFPAHRLRGNRAPTLQEMLRTYFAIKEVGLKNIRLGNCHVFARNREDWDLLMAAVGREGLG
jgi:hypothetical protein